MPIFEYICKKCESQFELFIRGESDAQAAACPECQSKRIEKQFSVFGMSGVEARGSGSGASCSTCSATSCSTCR